MSRYQLLAEVEGAGRDDAREDGAVLAWSRDWRTAQRERSRRVDLASQGNFQVKTSFFKSEIPLNFKIFSKNETVSWFDWADGEPNNQQGEYCLVMREYHDPIFPIFRDYFWNDFDCNSVAHYICEKQCV